MENTLQSLDLGLQLIQAFSSHDRLTVRHAAKLCDASVSSAFRSLQTLESRGFVVLSSRGRGYVAGPSLMALQMPTSIHPKTKALIRPVLQSIRQKTGESVHAATLLGNQVLVVDGRSSRYESDIGLRIGMTAPAHAMAAGKLLLSHLDDNQVRAIVPQENLVRRGPGTVASRTLLLEQLDEIRRTGIAFAFQESEPGINSFALNLHGDSWRSRIALVVSAPVLRAKKARLIELADIVKSEVEQLLQS